MNSQYRIHGSSIELATEAPFCQTSHQMAIRYTCSSPFLSPVSSLCPTLPTLLSLSKFIAPGCIPVRKWTLITLSILGLMKLRWKLGWPLHYTDHEF